MNRNNFGQVLLVSLFIFFVLLSWLLKGGVFNFVTMDPILLSMGGNSYPVALGHFSLQTICLVFALIILFLLHEFFGFAATISSLLSASIVLAGLWVIMKGLPLVASHLRLMGVQEALAPLVLGSKRDIIKACLTISVGFLPPVFFFEIFRRITHNTFSIIRLFLAQVLGLGAVAFVISFLENYPNINDGLWMANALSHYIHWFLIFVFLIPVYYLLRIPFWVISRGDRYKQLKSKYTGKKSKNKLTPQVSEVETRVEEEKTPVEFIQDSDELPPSDNEKQNQESSSLSKLLED